jgi:hypothetical protein
VSTHRGGQDGVLLYDVVLLCLATSQPASEGGLRGKGVQLVRADNGRRLSFMEAASGTIRLGTTVDSVLLQAWRKEKSRARRQKDES